MTRERDDVLLGTPELKVGKVPNDKRARARITVADRARDVDDLAVLIDMLDLHPNRDEP